MLEYIYLKKNILPQLNLIQNIMQYNALGEFWKGNANLKLQRGSLMWGKQELSGNWSTQM